jgi:hypothetical protein
MNIKVVVEIGDNPGHWRSIENVGAAEVTFDWPHNTPIPNLYAMVEGLSIEALRLHLEEVAKAAKE